jgi:hypothetical protein
MKRSEFLSPRKEVEPDPAEKKSLMKEAWIAKMPKQAEEISPVEESWEKEVAVQYPEDRAYDFANERTYAEPPTQEYAGYATAPVAQAEMGVLVDIGNNPVGTRIMSGGYTYTVTAITLNVDQYNRRTMQINLQG